MAVADFFFSPTAEPAAEADPSPSTLCREAAAAFLNTNSGDLGHRSSLDLDALLQGV